MILPMTPERIIHTILKQRGLTTKKAIEAWLHPDYDRDSHDPMLLPDMKKALRRLMATRTKREKITIYGDYDVDGLCATALLMDALPKFGFEVSAYIPDRFSEGYGLSQKGIDEIASSGAKLIITVDCGISAAAQISYALKLGIDVIVTDHHEPPDQLPSGAAALINPKLPGSEYPFSDLCGAGVAFKLVQALQAEFNQSTSRSADSSRSGFPNGLAPSQEKWLLDLVALATVCDVVSLTGENRMMVKFGLQVLQQTRRPGLRAMAQISGVELESVNATTLGFAFGPRLNASGRLTHARDSLALLTSDSRAEAYRLAMKLDRLNQERRAQQAGIEQQARVLAPGYNADPVLVLGHESWSHGVVGIVSARLLERYQKPVFLMQIMGERAKGSIRSFGDFSAAAALKSLSNLLISGGGHKAAGGFTILSEHIDIFRREVNKYYRSLKLIDQIKHLTARADLELKDLSAVTLELAQPLGQLEPFGYGNPEPLFGFTSLEVITARRVGAERQHLSLRLADRAGNTAGAIAFREEQEVEVCDRLDLLVHIDVNEFRGLKSVQLRVRSLKKAIAV